MRVASFRAEGEADSSGTRDGTGTSSSRPADYSGWPDREAVAQVLGVNVRQIARMVEAGKLQRVRWRPPGAARDAVVYHPDDVRRLAAQRQPGPQPWVLPVDRAGAEADDRPDLHLGDSHALVGPASVGLVEQLLVGLIAMVRSAGAGGTSEGPTSHASRGVFLRDLDPDQYVGLDEAASLKGVTRWTLLKAARTGKLPVLWERREGRRVRRIRVSDLRAL